MSVAPQEIPLHGKNMERLGTNSILNLFLGTLERNAEPAHQMRH